jgi:hypothetical protein
VPVEGPVGTGLGVPAAAELDGVEEALAKNARAFRRCYDRGLSQNPLLWGKVRVRIVVTRDGRTTATDEGSELPDPEVVACIVRRWQEVPFDPPERAGRASAVVAITFLPATEPET